MHYNMLNCVNVFVLIKAGRYRVFGFPNITSCSSGPTVSQTSSSCSRAFRRGGQVERSWRDCVAHIPELLSAFTLNVAVIVVRMREETLGITACVLSWSRVDSAAARVWCCDWTRSKVPRKEVLGLRGDPQRESPRGLTGLFLIQNLMFDIVGMCL